MDEQKVRWQCVQAFAGSGGQSAAQATEIIEQNGAEVPVVCTPSGGEQTIRLNLPQNWETEMSDAELIQAIAKVSIPRQHERSA